MLIEGVTTLVVSVFVCVLPGWLWARVLWPERPDEGWTERITISTALSLALVPAAALGLARIFGGGVTTSIAAASVMLVFSLGAVVLAVTGTASPTKVIVRQDIPRRVPGAVPLVSIGLAFGLVFASYLISPRDTWQVTVECWGWGGADCTATGEAQMFVPVIALLLVFGTAWYSYKIHAARKRTKGKEESQLFVTDEVAADTPTGLQKFLLPVIVIAVLVRNFSGVVLHDWPFVRGVDHYSHAVMANRMMSVGYIEPYFVYPSGFHTVVANISRLGGLDPLDIFPFMGPLLPILPVLACYTLAKRVWGWKVGVAAAFFVGMVTSGPYFYLTDSMYPNLVGAQFLLVLTVAAIVTLYFTPTLRSVIMVAVLGSSVVLFHSVASLYLALILAFISVLVLPVMFSKDRRVGVALFASFALLSFISFFYAWDIYDLPTVIASTLGFAEAGATGDAVSSAIGTQKPFSVGTLVGGLASQPVAWLAVVGVVLSSGAIITNRGQKLPVKMAVFTLLVWVMVIIGGSLTPLTGFPQRFGRDIGIPLSLFAAFALVWLISAISRMPRERSVAFYAATVSFALIALITEIKVAQGFQQATTTSWRTTTTTEISAAGDWLRDNNTGGNIMVGPQRNQVPSRMMLAMGDYSAMQSFTRSNILLNRDLPPGGAMPMEDVLSVIYYPASVETPALLEKYDVRYIVHYKDMPDRGVVEYWREFELFPDLYDNVFENSDVVIYAPRPTTTP